MATLVLVKTSSYILHFGQSPYIEPQETPATVNHVGYSPSFYDGSITTEAAATVTVNSIRAAEKLSKKKSHDNSSTFSKSSATPNQTANSFSPSSTATNTAHPTLDTSTDHQQPNTTTTGPMVDHVPCLLPFEFCTATSHCCTDHVKFTRILWPI